MPKDITAQQDNLQMDLNKIEVIAFDYGNTLIEFGASRIAECDRALREVLSQHYGPIDEERFIAIRDANREAILAEDPPTFRENDLHYITRQMIIDLYQIEPSDLEVQDLIQARTAIFLSQVQSPPYLHRVLETLSRQHRLALLSNYPSGPDIRSSLSKIHITKYFNAIVISGEVGYVKPQPRPFQTMIDQLGASPSQIVYVGDNWFADIQGAKRMGLQAIWTRQFEPVKQIPKQPGDFHADLVIEHLEELLQLFMSK